MAPPASHKLRYLRPAARDLRDQMAYYRTVSRGTDDRFRAAVRVAENLARRHAAGFARVTSATDVRAVVVRSFPFRLMYMLRDDTIVVVAIAHTARPLNVYLGRL